MRLLMFSLLVGGLVGCAAPAGKVASTASVARPDAIAQLVDATGADRGMATVSGGRLEVDVTGLPPGTHGLHVHAVGRCDPPKFESAGAHWNPSSRQHGRDNPMGMHMGDLPNIEVGSDGKGALGIDLPAGYEAALDADGASIIVHATADDYRTDPSGNSGGRIACGVFKRP